MVGGKESDLEQARPLIDRMARDVIHAGGTGMGAALKMVFNMLVAQAMLSFSEGLILGESLGLPRERLFEILTGSAVVAPLAAGKRAKIEADNYEADFPLQWMQKDLELVSLSAYEQGLALPSANLTKAIYMLAARYGLAEQDFSAIYQFLRENRRDEP
jgi:3-hydroxyisobutyrate dehydrogenase/glyoxylate/succinic semialdehyde reductase